MKRDPAVFLKEALAFPPEARAAIAASLLESLEADGEPIPPSISEEIVEVDE